MRKLFLLLALCLPSHAAIALVAHAWGGGAVVASAGPINCTGANFLVAVSVDFGASGDSPHVADSVGSNTWISLNNSNNGASYNSAIQYAYNAAVSSSMSFTKGGSFPAIFVACFSGVQSSSDPFDKQSQAQGATVIGAGSITPSANNELVVAGMASSTTGLVYTIDSGYTITDQSPLVGGTNEGGALAYLVQTSASATNPQWGITTAGSDNIAATIASFKAAPAGGYVANPTVIVVGP